LGDLAKSRSDLINLLPASGESSDHDIDQGFLDQSILNLVEVEDQFRHSWSLF
jgi:hypothetical protein